MTSHQAPLPSMLIAMPLLASTPVKADPMNCEPHAATLGRGGTGTAIERFYPNPSFKGAC
jgi:hypothetical protein